MDTLPACSDNGTHSIITYGTKCLTKQYLCGLEDFINIFTGSRCAYTDTPLYMYIYIYDFASKSYIYINNLSTHLHTRKALEEAGIVIHVTLEPL